MRAERIGADRDLARVFDEQIAIATGIDAVARERHAVTTRQMDVVFLAANDISGDRPQAGRSGRVACRLANADVATPRRRRGLDRIRRDGDFVDARPRSRRVDVNLGGWFGGGIVLSVVVVFDVISRDLQVANFRAFDSDSAQAVVTDVASGDVDLMKINFVQEDADAGVVVEVAMADDDVAIPLRQMDPVATAPNENSLDDRLPRLD